METQNVPTQSPIAPWRGVRLMTRECCVCGGTGRGNNSGSAPGNSACYNCGGMGRTAAPGAQLRVAV
jgi:hypothetical protein